MGDEKGGALIYVIIVTILAVAVAAAFMFSTTERAKTAVVFTDYTILQKIADAGLEKTRRALYNDYININNYLTNSFNSGTSSLDTIKQNFLNATALTQMYSNNLITLNTNMKYDDNGVYIRIFDDDADTDGNDTNAEKMTDTNNMIRIEVTATSPNGEQKRIDCIAEYIPQGYTPNAALKTNGSVAMGGSATINGSLGVVMANGNLTVGGSASIYVAGYAAGTASGAPNVYSNQPAQNLPHIDSYEYTNYVDYFIAANGLAYQKDPMGSFSWRGKQWTLVGDTNVGPTGWNGIKNGSGANMGNFTVTGSDTSSTSYIGTYFFEVPNVNTNKVSLTANANRTITVFTNGSVDMQGGATLTPYLPNTMVIADKDLKISGTGTMLAVSGLLASGEQVHLTGNATITGSVLAEDYADTATLVTTSSVIQDAELGGSSRITYNGMAGTILRDPSYSLVVRFYNVVK